MFLRACLRSRWSPVVVLAGLAWAASGVSILADPRIDSRVDIASVVIGVGTTGLGLALVWAGARTGVVRTPDGLRVRGLVGGTSYEAGTIVGCSVGQRAHDLLPLQVVFPLLRMAEDRDEPVMSLAAFDLLPSARRRVARAATTMAAWTGRPVLD